MVKLYIQPAAGAIFPIDGLLGPAQTSSRQAARGRDAPQSLRQLEEPTLVWPSRPGAFEGPTLVWPWRPVAFEWLVYWYIQPAAGAFFFQLVAYWVPCKQVRAKRRGGDTCEAVHPARRKRDLRQLMTYWASREEVRAKRFMEGIFVKHCIQPAAGAVFSN